MSAVERQPEESRRSAETGNANPVILDLGKRKRKRIKDLREGKGKLLTEVLDAVEELRAAGTISQNAQPVIVVVGEKPKSDSFLPRIGL